MPGESGRPTGRRVGNVLADFNCAGCKPSARAGENGDLLGRVSSEDNGYRRTAGAPDQWRSVWSGFRPPVPQTRNPAK